MSLVLELVAGVASPAWETLFNGAGFHALNLQPGQRRLAIDAVDHDGSVIGRLAGVVDEDGEFCSGASAPFGGPDLARPEPQATEAVSLVAQALDGLAADGDVRRVKVRCRPASHGAGADALVYALLSAGFRVESCELNYAVAVSGLQSGMEHVASLKPKVRNEVRRALAEPYTFVTARTDDEWAAGYRVLADHHQAKGYPLRLSLDYLRRAEAAFPGRVRMDLLSHNRGLCAAAVSYRVRPSVELLVYWGDAHHSLARSPMPLLAHRLVERCIADGVATWDMGIATENGVLNSGLAFFKQRIGAVAEPRLTLVRDL